MKELITIDKGYYTYLRANIRAWRHRTTLWFKAFVAATLIAVIATASNISSHYKHESNTSHIDPDYSNQNIDEQVRSAYIDGEQVTPELMECYGEYTITYYCACEECCGKSDGITATGTQATEGRTIAVDPEVIPYGTEVIIDGHTYIAEDCGGSIKGKRIDIYVDDHDRALQYGIHKAKIYIKL